MPSSPLRLGLAGLGWWGQTLLRTAPDHHHVYRFVAGASPDADASQTAREYGLTAHADLKGLLERDDIDGVVLATPHSQHARQIAEAAGSGVHVYTEKPLALSLAEAVEAVDQCHDAGVVLGIGTDKRFLPAVQALETVVRGGGVGRVAHIEGNYSNDNMSHGLSGPWRAEHTEAPGGGLTGPALHVLDVAIQMLDPVEVVGCRLDVREEPGRVSDAVAIHLTTHSGATAAVTSVRGVPDYFRIAVLGSEGWAEVSGFGTLRMVRGDGPVRTDHYPPGLKAGSLLETWAKCVLDGEDFPVSPAEMLATTAVLDAAIHSLKIGARTAVAVDRGVA